jgi:hypothetical protein
MDQPQRQFRQFADPEPGAVRELDPPPEEHAAEDQHEEARDHIRRCLGAPLQAREQVHVEMRAFAHTDHRADHHHPDQQEARQLLGPDVARQQFREAGEDLQADRHDDGGHRHRQQDVEQTGIVEGDAAKHATRAGRRHAGMSLA